MKAQYSRLIHFSLNISVIYAIGDSVLSMRRVHSYIVKIVVKTCYITCIKFVLLKVYGCADLHERSSLLAVYLDTVCTY